MTCTTCRRDEYSDTCGSENGDPCRCCGMVIIARAPRQGEDHEGADQEGGEQRNNHRHS
jgi:hypothetical protein